MNSETSLTNLEKWLQPELLSEVIEPLIENGQGSIIQELLDCYVYSKPPNQKTIDLVFQTLDNKVVPVPRSHPPYSPYYRLTPRPQPHSRPLRFFSDKSFIPPHCQHTELLFPFWGKGHSYDIKRNNFDEFCEFGSAIFQMSSLENCDFAFFPVHYQPEIHQYALQFAEMVKAAGKKTVVIFRGDESDRIELPNSIILRTSFYKHNRDANEFSIPSFFDDLVAHYLNSTLPLRNKSELPVVSFCGQPIQEFLHHRNTALVLLNDSPLVKANFILRSGYSGGVSETTTPAEVHKRRLPFVKNLVEGDYVFCCRGAGNFSYRLYETLCVGRIPVFVDTECVLPFEDQIDWKNLCIWVDYRELGTICQRISDFHKNITNEEFIERQRNCRRVWEEFLSPLGFYNHLRLYL